MTLFVDPRAGSGPLYRPLRALSLPVRRKRMRFGDFAFRGHGPDHKRIRVGIEFKRLSDFISCIDDKRLVSHQIPGMCRRYDPLGRWLIIEGIIRPDRFGMLEEFHTFGTKRGKELGCFERTRYPITYSQVARYLTTLRKRAQFEVVFTSGRAESLGLIAALYHWYQKPWERHHAHLALPALQDNHPRRIEVLFRRPSVLRRVASCLPGIGWTRSEQVARKFRSVAGMVEARRKEWLSIPGIGPTIATAVHQALRGERDR